MKKCEFCGISSENKKVISTKRFGGNNYFCVKHYYQMVRHKEIKRTSRWSNEIRIVGNVCEMDLYDKKQNVVAVTKFSLEHLEEVKKHKWYYRKFERNYTGYAVTTNPKNISLRLGLHNLVCGFLYGSPKEGYTPDHLNRNGLDNTNENLEYKNQSMQNLNQKKRKDNTTGFKGVNVDNDRNGYEASFKCGSFKRRKRFKILEEAVQQRLQWEKEFQKTLDEKGILQ